MLGGDEDGAETRELGVFNSSFVREVRLLARAAHINRTISVITVKNTSQQYLRYVLADPLRQDLYVESLRCTTVMMVDVHDFTKITERTLEKEKLIVLLAAFFTHVETTAQKWGMPYLVKRIGDAVLLLFNSNLNPEDPEHAKNAIRAAISIHYEAMPKINDEVKTGWPTCPAKVRRPFKKCAV